MQLKRVLRTAACAAFALSTMAVAGSALADPASQKHADAEAAKQSTKELTAIQALLNATTDNGKLTAAEQQAKGAKILNTVLDPTNGKTTPAAQKLVAVLNKTDLNKITKYFECSYKGGSAYTGTPASCN